MRIRPVLLLMLVTAGALTAAGCDVLMPNRTPGERLWRKLCAECHGLDGAGNTVRAMGNVWADLRDDAWQNGGDRYSVEQSIRQGVFGKMPAHDELSREEMQQLIEHLFKIRGESPR